MYCRRFGTEKKPLFCNVYKVFYQKKFLNNYWKFQIIFAKFCKEIIHIELEFCIKKHQQITDLMFDYFNHFGVCLSMISTNKLLNNL